VNYSNLTRRYFEGAEALAGVLTGPGSFRGNAGSRAQGTWVQFDLRVDTDEARTIQAARFLAYACPHIIAAAAWMAEAAVGRSVGAAPWMSVQGLRERFAIPVEKLGRLLIVEDAWNAAVKACMGSTAG
jgi:NifU-like protein involved in Fe-S cluster formation